MFKNIDRRSEPGLSQTGNYGTLHCAWRDTHLADFYRWYGTLRRTLVVRLAMVRFKKIYMFFDFSVNCGQMIKHTFIYSRPWPTVYERIYQCREY
jgi:hypothetical protein